MIHKLHGLGEVVMKHLEEYHLKCVFKVLSSQTPLLCIFVVKYNNK